MTADTTAATDTLTAGRTAPSTSKPVAIHLAHRFVRHLPTGVDVYSWNPGFVLGTGLAPDASAIQRFAMKRVMPLMTLAHPSASRPGPVQDKRVSGSRQGEQFVPNDS